MKNLPAAPDGMTLIGRSETLAQKVKGQLKEAIMAGHFSPGEKLTIRRVAGELDVSLTPAREALYNLASEGALDLRSNGSVYLPALTVDRIVELTKIRVALESLASREAVRWINDDEITKIGALNEDIIKQNTERSFSKLIDLNWRFHFSIYRASRMEHLVRMIESCWLMTGSYLNVIYPKFGDMNDGINNHIQIFRALETRDGERLAFAISKDILMASDSLVDVIESGKKNDKV